METATPTSNSETPGCKLCSEALASDDQFWAGNLEVPFPSEAAGDCGSPSGGVAQSLGSFTQSEAADESVRGLGAGRMKAA